MKDCLIKSLFLIFVFTTIVNAEFQKIRIGKIDERYADKITKEELRVIIDEIELFFETQLSFNVFDYAEDGKPIDILYISPSQKKQELLKNTQNMKTIKNSLNALDPDIQKQKHFLEMTKQKLQKEYTLLNVAIDKLNTYIAEIDANKQNFTQREYNQHINSISLKKEQISSKQESLQQENITYENELEKLKEKLLKYNQLAETYNTISRDTEKLSSSFSEVKGITKGVIHSEIITQTEGDQTIKQIKSTEMNKIEVYDFENTDLLKVILAHEIGHLVGVEHIQTKGALMHPIIQEEQKKNLSLTFDDIQAFYEAF